MTIERSNPPALANPPGYSHVVKDGTTIYVAGQLSRNNKGETVGVGDFSAQAEQAFKNVQAALESVGSDMNHIMKMNVFMTEGESNPHSGTPASSSSTTLRESPRRVPRGRRGATMASGMVARSRCALGSSPS